MKQIKNILFFTVISLLFGGCGASYTFSKAKKLEKTGFYPQAVEKYMHISGKYPKSRYAPYAIYSAANIYRENLKIYTEAGRLYSELIAGYPDRQYWLTLAKIGILNSPDYFPLREDFSRVEGDSETHGRNMRAEQDCKIEASFPKTGATDETPVVTGYLYRLTKKYYAGDKLVTQVNRYYVKDNYELREMTSPDASVYTVLLSYPFEKKKSWTTVRDNRTVKLTVISSDASVRTLAGKFDNCLKVMEEDVRLPGAHKFTYYAPGVGQVLVTTGSSGKEDEYPNTELLSFK